MDKLKRVTYTEWIYSYEENNITRDINKFCEEKSKEVLNFKLESHSIIKNPGETSHSLYEGTYTSPDSFDIYITYSYDEEDDLSTYICTLKKDIPCCDTLLFKCEAERLTHAIFKSKNYFSQKLNVKLSDDDVICTLLEDIPEY